METNQLVKGNHYLVKHSDGKNSVRRAFKGTEKRFGSIECFVFTSKIDKRVSLEVLPDGFIYHSPYGVSTPSQEISIPFYDLKSVKATE